jgi:hypothetical protein
LNDIAPHRREAMGQAAMVTIIGLMLTIFMARLRL